jgi:polyhydroxyalkanoate synthase
MSNTSRFWDLFENSLAFASKAHIATEKYIAHYHDLMNMPAPFDPGKVISTLGLTYHHHLTSKESLGTAMDFFQDINQLNVGILEQIAQHTPIHINKDKRFQHPAWDHHPFFAWIQQTYHATCRYCNKQLETTPNLDDSQRRMSRFYLTHLLDAYAPTNHPWLNPEVIQKTINTQGHNLVQGAQKFFQDIAERDGFWQVTTRHPTAFKVGHNLATTPGDVVFRNELVEIIRYQPMTAQVRPTPLMIIAPWINKFYIFDLQPKNSFVRWALEQGFQVFITSWRNPTSEHRDYGWEDYIRLGILEPLVFIREATHSRQVHAIGYCIAGTMLTSAVAYLTKKRKFPFKSITLLTTMTDFSDPGDMKNFLDADYLKQLEQHLKHFGYMDHRALSQTFSLLSANSMIWNYVVRNYFLNQDPPPFDILHWNSDSTRQTEAMQRFTIWKLYLENRLREANGIRIAGTKLNLHRIKTPTYMLSTKEDHIAPWRSTYAATQIFSGPLTFVLGGSGHTAGVINAPSQEKYQYWTNNTLPEQADDWFAGAEATPGSWWPHWKQWICQFREDPEIASSSSWDFKKYKSIHKAPGTYVW